jgi:hypothetical protein
MVKLVESRTSGLKQARMSGGSLALDSYNFGHLSTTQIVYSNKCKKLSDFSNFFSSAISNLVFRDTTILKMFLKGMA